MRAPARRAQRGFTLIEVLVALALMALVSLISWRGLASVSSARDWIESQAEDTDAIVRSLGQLGRDVELSYDGPVFDPSAATRSRRPACVLRPPRRRRAGDSAPASGQPGLWQRVHWRVRPDGLGASGPRPRAARCRRSATRCCCRRQQHDAARLDSRHRLGRGRPRRVGHRRDRPRSHRAARRRAGPATLFARDGAAMIRPIPAPPRRDQRGAAVISALIIVAIGADYQPVPAPDRQRAPENEQSRLQARMLLAGGIDWRGWWCATTASARRSRARTRSGPPPSWTRASSVPATSAWPCSPAGWRTNRQVQPVQPGARRRSRPRNRCCGWAAAPAGHAGAAHHRHRGHGPAAGAARRSPSRGRAAARRARARGVQELAPRSAWIPPCATNCNAP